MDEMAQIIAGVQDSWTRAVGPAGVCSCGLEIAPGLERCEGCDERRRRLRGVLASVPPRFRPWRLDAPELAEMVRGGIPTVARARALLGARKVVIRGDAGAGKTSLVAAMFRAVVEGGIGPNARQKDTQRAEWALFASALELSQAIRQHPIGRGVPPLFDRAVHASVLVVDDLGTEDDTRAASELLFARHDSDRGQWVTTWMTGPQMAERYGAGVARRVYEHADVLVLDGGA